MASENKDYPTDEFVSGAALDWIPGAGAAQKKNKTKKKFRKIAKAILVIEDIFESNLLVSP